MNYYGLNSALKIIEPEVMACNLPLLLDPYLGCEHNCTYCYARALKEGVRKQWRADAIKPIDPNELVRLLTKVFNSPQPPSNPVRRALWHKFPVRIGTDTDPFSHSEKKQKITKRILEILNGYSYPYIINTKSGMVAEEEYLTLLKNSPAGAIVQFTIISLNEELIKKIEPDAPPVSKRLEATEALAEEGIYVQTRISPIIPELTDSSEDMRKLFKVLKEMGTKDLNVEYLRYNSFTRK